MTNLDCLPFDVIDYIVNCDCLSHIDLCRLSTVSKLFNCIVKSNKLWRKKYVQMWPELAGLFDAYNTDWHHEFRFRVDVTKLVLQKLSELPVEYYYDEYISDDAFLSFKDITRNHSLEYAIVIDELENLIHHTERHLKLTHKYYGRRALRYLRHEELKTRWKKFLSQPSEKMSFIEGVCLISEWCQPTLAKFSSQVTPCLEDLVKRTLEKIKQLFPSHPVLKQGILKDDRISSSLWSSPLCKNIIYCMNAVLFQDMKFVGSLDDCVSRSAALINQVLRKRAGMSLIVGIIYSAIAAKLGVCCEPVNFPLHFLLKWQEHPGLDEKQMYTFIDIMEGGALKTFYDVQNSFLDYDDKSTSWTENISPVKVFIKCAWFLVEFERRRNNVSGHSLDLCNSLELICLLSPDDNEHKFLLARVYLHLRINTDKAISLLHEISASYPTSPLMNGYIFQSTLQTLQDHKLIKCRHSKKLQRRSATCSGPKYAVGMLMRHIRYGFRCVIYGWDYSCSASEDWMIRMETNKLKRGSKQPFYFILTDDGTKKYTAEDNLEIDVQNIPITHNDVGRYFQSFHGSYYMLNEQTIEEYPDDITAREEALGQRKGEQEPSHLIVI